MRNSSWYKVNMFAPSVSSKIMFGPAEFKEIDGLYPNRQIKKGATIFWFPEQKVHISLASYFDAIRNGDAEAQKKITDLGLPLYLKMGFRGNEDFSTDWTEVKQPKASKPKAPSYKIMRVKFKGMFDDGNGSFKPGEIVKIRFRAKYIKTYSSGEKKFENAYYKPSAEEVAAFLKEEKTGIKA